MRMTALILILANFSTVASALDAGTPAGKWLTANHADKLAWVQEYTDAASTPGTIAQSTQWLLACMDNTVRTTDAQALTRMTIMAAASGCSERWRLVRN
ncbi:MAG: hypothetical protein QM718_00140 [Steroidobacteraceae bacterium]